MACYPFLLRIVLFTLQVFLKFYHADQMAQLLVQSLNAYLFVQNGMRRYIARFRFVRIKAAAKQQQAAAATFFDAIAVSMIACVRDWPRRLVICIAHGSRAIHSRTRRQRPSRSRG